jgi:cytochrome P450/nitrite reductase/ring-hydroxylating ferredoxin subunit
MQEGLLGAKHEVWPPGGLVMSQSSERSRDARGAGLCTSEGWVRIGTAEDLAGPGPFAATAGDTELVLVRAPDGLRAFEGRCPHQGALLAESEIIEGELVCRNHHWRFDIATGRRRGGEGGLRACPLRQEQGVVFARTEARAPTADRPTCLRTLDQLPGPRGIPFLGNLRTLNLGRLHRTLEDWAVRYGSVYRLRLAGRPVIAISDPGLIQRALRDRPGAFRRLGNMEPIARELGIRGVITAEGAEWRPLRRLTMEALSPVRLRAFYPALLTVAKRLHRRWEREAGAGRPVDVEQDFKRFTVDLTTQLAFGHDLNTLEEEGDVLEQQLGELLTGITRRLFAVVPLWRIFKLPVERRLERTVADVMEVLRRLLGSTRARLASAPGRAAHPETFLEAMILARDEAGKPFSDGEILGNAIQILLAGEDTTAHTLSWAVHEICDRPEVASALRDEADRVLDGNAVPADVEALGRLVFAGAVANETMRLRPVAPLILLDTNEDLVLGDLSLRKGQTVFLLMRAPAVSGRHFAVPDAFRPERWLHQEPGAAHDPSAHLPFGSGPRLCPGRTLALTEMKVALATLFGGFSVERVGTRAEVSERFAFTMGPRGLRVMLRRRSDVTRGEPRDRESAGGPSGSWIEEPEGRDPISHASLDLREDDGGCSSSSTSEA